MECPFCSRDGVAINEHWSLLSDHYPVAEGHHLLVPSRHVEHLAALTPDERTALGPALMKAWCFVEMNSKCMDGFNIGLNQGAAAGQTVPHIHFHFIPRRKGDVEDPRGGVRGVIPSKRVYEIAEKNNEREVPHIV